MELPNEIKRFFIGQNGDVCSSDLSFELEKFIQFPRVTIHIKRRCDCETRSLIESRFEITIKCH